MNRVAHHGRPGAVQAADAKGHEERNKAAHAVAMCASLEECLRVHLNCLMEVHGDPCDSTVREAYDDLRVARRATMAALESWRDLCGVK